MNIRYRFITSKDEQEAKNDVKNAFLAAKNGQDVEQIINALLTTDETIKLGRRIQIASMLMRGMTGEDIKSILKVGRNTITLVVKHIAAYPDGFTLIKNREKKVAETYEKKKFRKVGGSTLVFKKKEYTGFKRSDVGR